jgi:hypothetical protein
MKIYRQGDVLLVESKLPEGSKKVKRAGDVILAYGEVTGHAHRLAEGTVTEHQAAGRRFITTKGANLTHEEHSTITLPRGTYEVIQQVEYQKEFKPVVD